MVNYITFLLAVSWIVLIIYLIVNKKFIPINLFGVMLVTSLIQPYLMFYSVTDNTFMIETRWENIVNRFLFLLTFFVTIQEKKYLNKKLTNMSKKEENLLKLNKE